MAKAFFCNASVSTCFPERWTFWYEIALPEIALRFVVGRERPAFLRALLAARRAGDGGGPTKKRPSAAHFLSQYSAARRSAFRSAPRTRIRSRAHKLVRLQPRKYFRPVRHLLRDSAIRPWFRTGFAFQNSRLRLDDGTLRKKCARARRERSQPRGPGRNDAQGQAII